jgi:rubrerythrin
VALSKTKKEIAQYLYCSSILEENVATAYESFANRTENPIIEPLLLFISYDSLKHSEVLRKLSQNITITEPTIEDCEKILGKAWKNAVAQAHRETLKKEKIVDQELASLIDKMIDFESFVGEEYLAVLQLKTLELVAKGSEIDLEGLKRILEWIIEDEERHEIILARIKIIITRRVNSSIHI